MKIPHRLGLPARLGVIQLGVILTIQAAQAGSATWSLTPLTGDWNTAANWSPATVPNNGAVAIFSISNQTHLALSADVTVNSIVFASNASAFTISIPSGPVLTLSGAGVINNSGVTQNFIASEGPESINFINSAQAGNATYTLAGNGGSSALVQFFGSSSAGNATFDNNGGPNGGGTLFLDSSTTAQGTFFNRAAPANGGATDFFDTANAGSATFICDGGSPAAPIQGFMYFLDSSSAANATIVANGASGSRLSVGIVTFYENSTAANAHITANGGTVPGAGGARIYVAYIDGAPTLANATVIANGGTNGGGGGTVLFGADSSGGQARLEVFDNAKLDLQTHNLPGVTVGSIEGNGLILLGGNNLTVGTNDLSTEFSGLIQDGHGSSGGSLSKTGNGTLNLTSANKYTDGTLLSGNGALFLNNKAGSATGTSAVVVDSGTLGGAGFLTGSITVGTGSGGGAFLSPGKSKGTIGILTTTSPLALNADATYVWKLDSQKSKSAAVVAAGVAINSAVFSPLELRAGTLSAGTVFTVIDDTGPTPIAGAFSNLTDGAMVTVGSNKFQADYEGGDGNDLTLTVQ